MSSADGDYQGPMEIPEGKTWCPDCNGEGEVWVMQATPDMNEVRYRCGRCVEGLIDIEVLHEAWVHTDQIGDR